MNKERPIIFGSEMVKTILEGRKTQTRRVIKPQPSAGVRFSPFVPGQVEDGHGTEMRCPYAVDRLWARETWGYWGSIQTPEWVIYRADGDKAGMRWISPIFMPRWASRITLQVTSIRVEQLQEISERDCCLEMGCAVKWPGPGPEPYKRNLRGLFGKLWDSINAKRGYGWDNNPYVWVVEFERVGS